MKNIFTTIILTILFCIFLSNSSQVLAKELYLDEDLNKDGIVDILDISLMTNKYNTNYALYDLNKDSIIDIYDLTKASKSLNKTSFGLGMVTGEKLNLRSAPDTSNNSNILTQLFHSYRFFIVDDLGEWYKIKYDNNGTLLDGYVYALYTLPLRDNYFDSYLGFISSRNESTIYDVTGSIPISVRNPGTISNNPDDPGGKSYGQYQLATKVDTVGTFLSQLKTNPEGIAFYDKLKAAKTADGETYGTNFDEAWRSIASTNFDDFFELQRIFVKKEYYDSAALKLKIEHDFDISSKSFALKEALWSTAVQYGVKGDGIFSIGAVDIFLSAGLDKLENELITNIYDIKIEHAEKQTNAVLTNALKNRALSEQSDVLYMYNIYKEISK